MTDNEKYVVVQSGIRDPEYLVVDTDTNQAICLCWDQYTAAGIAIIGNERQRSFLDTGASAAERR